MEFEFLLGQLKTPKFRTVVSGYQPSSTKLTNGVGSIGALPVSGSSWVEWRWEEFQSTSPTSFGVVWKLVELHPQPDKVPWFAPRALFQLMACPSHYRQATFCLLWSTGCHNLCAMIEIHHFRQMWHLQIQGIRLHKQGLLPFHFEDSEWNEIAINRLITDLSSHEEESIFSMCNDLWAKYWVANHPFLASTSLNLVIASIVFTDLVKLCLVVVMQRLNEIRSDQEKFY